MSNPHNSLVRGFLGLAALALACAVPVLAQTSSSASSGAPSASESTTASQGASASSAQATAGQDAQAQKKAAVEPQNKVHAATDVTNIGQQELADIGKELFVLLVVVTLLESAMASLFQWRAYTILFNAKAMKMPILFIAGGIMVYSLDYDPFLRLLVAAKVLVAQSLHPTAFTLVVSALIMAGGSAGVNGLFRAFGIRRESATPEPMAAPDQKAWVSVLVKSKKRPSGPIQVLIEKDSSLSASAPVVGMVDTATSGQKLKALFTANGERFPNYGGWAVDAGDPYRIKVKWGVTPNDEKVVFEGRFAEHAIVDLVVNI